MIVEQCRVNTPLGKGRGGDSILDLIIGLFALSFRGMSGKQYNLSLLWCEHTLGGREGKEDTDGLTHKVVVRV